MKHGPKTHQFFERASKVMPYGVSSNFRIWGEDTNPMVADACQGYIYDFDGKRYIDYRLAFGPVILGHGDPFVNQRVSEAIQHGTCFAATQEYEVQAAEHIVAMCPGVDMVRFVSTGTEATMSAVRLARGHTGRDVILKFEGSYHGGYDYVLWSTARAPIGKLGDRRNPIGHKQSLGIPEAMRDLIQTCPWNDTEVLGEILQKRGHEIAAIIIEPVLGNAAALTPKVEYFQFLRQQCDHYGIVLIFDEVKTGFRLAPGGAREVFGILPDISTYAKAMGNGFPIAAIAGSKELMLEFRPGRVFQTGTYAGNVVGTAAAAATLERIRQGDVFAKINHVGGLLIDGISEILTRHSVPHHMYGTPGMFGFSFMEKEAKDWRDLQDADWDLYEDIVTHMIANGVMPEPDGLEPWFTCASHTEADAMETLQKFEDGLNFAKGHPNRAHMSHEAE